jgi:hypothetical protein
LRDTYLDRGYSDRNRRSGTADREKLSVAGRLSHLMQRSIPKETENKKICPPLRRSG